MGEVESVHVVCRAVEARKERCIAEVNGTDSVALKFAVITLAVPVVVGEV